ncbi:MAG: VOC family protein [Burkholderiales bacterium]|nr:VOC family protein [Anaerolineae bacterium]
MILNHMNLTVTDVMAAENFLVKYFDMQAYEGEDQRDNFRFLFDDNGFVLTLMQGSRKTEVKYAANFHIGFGQPSEERVNEINQRLKDDNFDVQPPQRWHAWTFYVEAPGGFTVEVFC